MQDNIPNVENGWFTEAQLPNQPEQDIRISTKVTEVLYSKPSPFGDVQIFDTPFYGRMLALDGIIQVAENDEFIYHEMMVTLPAIKHGNPESILIIGGGDGGAVKQATRIPSVKRIVLVEIDQSVVDMCQKYIPAISDGSLEDPRVEVVIADGKDYVNNSNEQFDVIALDLTDPIPEGPAAELFEENFYKSVKKILAPAGYMSTHCGSLLFQQDEAKMLIDRLKNVFDEVAVHSAVVPTYQLSSFGFLVVGNHTVELSAQELESRFSKMPKKLQYLTPETYLGSLAIPPYLQTKIL